MTPLRLNGPIYDDDEQVEISNIYHVMQLFNHWTTASGSPISKGGDRIAQNAILQTHLLWSSTGGFTRQNGIYCMREADETSNDYCNDEGKQMILFDNLFTASQNQDNRSRAIADKENRRTTRQNYSYPPLRENCDLIPFLWQ